MLYQLEDDATSIEVNELNDKILTVGFVSLSELDALCKPLGLYAKSVEKCKISSSLTADIDMLEDYCFFILNTHCEDRLAIFVKKNLVLIVNILDTKNKNKDYFFNLVSSCKGDELSVERVLCSLLDLLLSASSKLLSQKRSQISELEENVLTSATDKDFNQRLLGIRSDLLQLSGFCEGLISISETLADNSNMLFDDSQLPLFELFTKKAERCKDNLNLISDSVVHLWDSFQAHLDTRLNETMKIFTMITTVFFPLTVIVGWYGMNFRFMPELNATWGYPFVIILSVGVVAVLIVWFRLRKWI